MNVAPEMEITVFGNPEGFSLWKSQPFPLRSSNITGRRDINLDITI